MGKKSKISKSKINYKKNKKSKINYKKNKKSKMKRKKNKSTKAGLMVRINEDHLKTCREAGVVGVNHMDRSGDCVPCALNFIGFDLETCDLLSRLSGEGMPSKECLKLLENKYPQLDFSILSAGNIEIKNESYEKILNELFSKIIENNYAILTILSFEDKSFSHMVIMGKENDIPFFFDTQEDKIIHNIPDIAQYLLELKVTNIRIILGKDKATGEIYKDDYSLGL